MNYSDELLYRMLITSILASFLAWFVHAVV
jgi:hypothetical protein